ncbi:hypothetical protein GGF43_002208 [Coemansia sp. RSA 2618]|nr:hypothetical protein GGF43_002208 [Coemansia sp. RSA 2618]
MTDGAQNPLAGNSRNPLSASDVAAPEITVNAADSTAASGTSSPVLSYVHTPAEPYVSDFTHNKQPIGKQHSLLQTASLQRHEDSRNATVASLQAAIDDAPMVPGSAWYLVGRKWYSAWQESASGLVSHEVGPIDNSEIVDASGELLPGLKLSEDLEAVPASAWQKMAVLYGVHEQQQVRRVAMQSGEDGKAVLDLYPPSVFVMSKGSLGSVSGETMHRVVISLGASLAELKFQIRRRFNLDSDQGQFGGMKLFRPAAEHANGSCASNGLSANGAVSATSDTTQNPPPYEATVASDRVVDLGINAGSKTAEKLEEISADDSVLLMAAGILPDSTVVFEPLLEASIPLHDQMTALADDDTASDTNSTGLTAMVADMTHGAWDDRAMSGNLPSPSSDEMDEPGEIDGSGAAITSAVVRSTGTSAQVHYLCGLNNLGNTCFMNSALQCLGHFRDLTQYFVSNVYTSELNRENPLGMKGAVASAYGRLVKAMWEIGRGAYAPRMFKQTIAQWAPQFRGYNQQDAPEFLAFLLDGMHEDLNRIIHKPYIEVPDASGRPDAVIADEQWDIYKRRNDSVVVDLFQGQYRSTLVCPQCSHLSVTFDPFMYLTLPLPIQRQKWVEVLFIPLDTGLRAMQMHLLVRKDDTVKHLKQVVAHFAQCDAANLLACDIISTRMYSVYSDSDALGDIRDTDIVQMYEVGVDTARAAADPSSEPSAVVQLLCSRPPAPSSYGGYSYSYGPDLVTKPLMLTLPKTELTLGELYLQIAKALARWSTVDMSRIIGQLQQAGSNGGGESDEQLLELLGRAACLSVHRASPPSQGQYRNLSSISSYMYPGRRSFGPPSAFRAFEDRITNDSCEPLTAAKDKGAASESDIGPSYIGPAPIAGPVVMASREGSRRRPRADLDADDYSTNWDSSSDNEGDCAMQGTPKRPRSDNESDSEARESCQVTPLFTPTANDNSNVEDADPAQPKPISVGSKAEDAAAGHPAPVNEDKMADDDMVDTTQVEPVDAEADADSSSDEDMASATAALSFADLMGTKVTFNTGDTLLCEWSAAGTTTLLAELGSDLDAAGDPIAGMFDFNRVDEFAMPAMDDATQYRSLEPVELLQLNQAPRKAPRPSAGGQRQRNVTLEDCLAEFTRPEQLGEEDPWYCGTCKEHQQATKKFDLWRVPEILVVHLKRFQHSRAWRDKIDVLVDFPLTGLDLTQTVAGPSGGELVYDLHSVCNHYGGMGGGHYTAYALNPEDNKWYDFNDSSVSEVHDPDSVKTTAAYMLFYRLRASEHTDGSAVTAKIERLISEFKETGAQPPADDDMKAPSDMLMRSQGMRAMSEDSTDNDYTLSISGLGAGPVHGMDSPRSDLGNASDMEADSPATAPATPPKDDLDDYSSLL